MKKWRPGNWRNRVPFREKGQGEPKMESAGFRDPSTRQGLKERPTLKQNLGTQPAFAYSPEQHALGFASLFDLKEVLPARLYETIGLHSVCANLTAGAAQKAA
jgi:hypothetical protein